MIQRISCSSPQNSKGLAIDEIDRNIVSILRREARISVADIGRRLGLTSAPVARRIERLERDGVIKGYTAVVDDTAAGELDAFTEIRLAGEVESAEIERLARQIPEVQQVFTLAGDTDALIRFRVENVDHLQRVVNAIRRTGKVSATKTLIVMATWDRMGQDPV